MKNKPLKDQDVLVVGSGADLKGRHMAKFVDEWPGTVIRCNKEYCPEDSGTRTDIFFTRWNSWIGRITPRRDDCDYVVINDALGYSTTEQEMTLAELGHSAASCGLHAVAFARHRGARRIYAIGFGYSPASRCFFPKSYAARYDEKKNLAVTQYGRDANPHYNWRKENEYLVDSGVILL